MGGVPSFIHAADLHLDTPFSGLAKVDPSVRDALVEASLEAFDNLIRVAVDRRVQFVILAGDVYDGAERGVRAQLRFRQGVQRLSDAGIFTFIAAGNHDPVGEGWQAIGSWPDRVFTFPSGGVQSIEVPDQRGAVIATVHGISYETKACTENLALRFRPPTTPGLHVGVLHANVGSNADHAPYSPCSVADLVAGGMHYWALGHVHLRSELSRQPFVEYPGNLQGRSLKPAELGAKGALLVSFEGTHVLQPEFVELDCARFERVSIDIAAAADIHELSELLSAAVNERAMSAGGRTLIVRCEAEGRGSTHGVLRSRDRLTELLASLRDEFPFATRRVWIDSIVDHTRPDIDVDALRQRQDFVGSVVGEADRLRNRPEDLDEFLAEPLLDVAANYRQSLSRRVRELPDARRRDLVDAALSRVVDSLGLADGSDA
jgi:exonuclease SbcD